VRKRAPPLLKHVGLTGTLLPHELQFLKLTRSVLAVAWVSSGLTSRRTYGLVVDTVAVGMVSNRA
jgi:xanthosine utilization system XapX-like protein